MEYILFGLTGLTLYESLCAKAQKLAFNIVSWSLLMTLAIFYGLDGYISERIKMLLTMLGFSITGVLYIIRLSEHLRSKTAQSSVAKSQSVYKKM